MKKTFKLILIILGIIVGIILLDSVQALIFNNNPIIGIQTRGMKKEGILVDTYHCGNGKYDTVIKGFSYSCSYKGGNYILVDNAKVCASMKSEFYRDENYIYYWDCIKGYDMLVKYDNGYVETISEALKQGHINIQDLDKFEIDYIKEEKVSLAEVNNFIIEYFSKEDTDNSNLVFNYVDNKNGVVVVGLLDNTEEKQEEFIYNVFSNCCGSTYIKCIKENKIIKFKKAEQNQNHND